MSQRYVSQVEIGHSKWRLGWRLTVPAGDCSCELEIQFLGWRLVIQSGDQGGDCTLGCLISDPIRYILIKEKMHLIGSTLRVFSRNLPWTPMACNWSIPDIPSIPGIV